MQEVSGAFTSPFLDTDEVKMALRAQNVSEAFEKRAPGDLVIRGKKKTLRGKKVLCKQETVNEVANWLRLSILCSSQKKVCVIF